MRKEVLVFFNEIAEKNLLQARCIREMGLIPVYFVTTPYDKTPDCIYKADVHYLRTKNPLSRIQYIRQYLKARKNQVNHIEVYPGGRFAFMIVLLAKAYSVKCICAERGDLLYYHRKGYDLLTRSSMWFCYHYADLVWYRELYMADKLREMGVKNTFFVHNAIEVSERACSEAEKDIDFLWLNRIVPQRRSDWLTTILNKPAFNHTRNVLVGYQKETLYHAEQDQLLNEQPSNLTIKEYSQDDVTRFYRRAKFFVFPAETVFANNALLEAMSFGVVPIVSSQPGTNLIVEDGKNGIVSNHSQQDFENAMLRALSLSDEEYNALSAAARDQINSRFSAKQYFNKLSEMYAQV